MALVEPLDQFEAGFRAAVVRVLPRADVYTVRRTTDLCLIDGERRLFGYDNLGGWHRHPIADPSIHEPCEEPSIERFLAEVAAIAGPSAP